MPENNTPSPDAIPIDLSVPPDAAGRRFDAYVAEQITAQSRTVLRQAIRDGRILLNDGRAKPSVKLSDGDKIVGSVEPTVDDGPIPEDIPLTFVHLDDDLAIVNKQPGMVVHPAKGHWSGTLTSALAFHLEHLSDVGGSTRPGIVHRLDRDTSGLIVVAKNNAAHLHLSRQFEQRTVSKQYLAICRGAPDRDQDIVDQPIGNHPYQREKKAIRAGHSTSREATTVYEVLERFRGFSLIAARPRTGRTHQIRLHLAHIGHAVVCDRLYAGHARLTAGELLRSASDEVLLERQALHAWKLEFEHPRTEERVQFEAPLPEDMSRLLEVLRSHRSLA